MTKLAFHNCTDQNHLRIWSDLIHDQDSKGKSASPLTHVCSNHFPFGRPLPTSPFPTMYLRGYGSAGKEQFLHDHSIVSAAKELDHAYTDFKTHHKKKLPTDKDRPGGETSKKISDGSTHPPLCAADGVCYRSEQDVNHCCLSSRQKALAACNMLPDDQKCSSDLPLWEASAPSKKKTAVSCKQESRTRTKKRNTRNTDHIYNTRKTKPAEEPFSFAKKVNNRDTDHLYNLRKADGDADKVSKTQKHRDTDHIYNIRKTDTHKLRGSANMCDLAVVKRNEATVYMKRSNTVDLTVVDRRVVDKDHMYQHSVRKNRSKSEHKNLEVKQETQTLAASGKKRNFVGVNDSSRVQKYSPLKDVAADTEDIAPPTKQFKSENKTSSCSSRQMRNTHQETTGRPKVCSVVTDFHTVSDPMFGPDHLDVQDSADVLMLTSAGTTTAISPLHSDNDSDHVCEDDSRMTGVWHTDHMYVHADYLDNGILENKVQPVLSQCFSVEGYKQEHSYANSEELHYDACVNCSELVQQLIGTIRQQGDQIDELKKKLRAANAKIKQLSNHQTEDLD